MPTAATEPVAKACKTEAGVSRAKFLEVYQGLKQDVLTDPMLSQTDAKSWMARMLDYNVPGGKLNRGMSVKDTLLTIKPDASPADHLLADQIGWAIEFLQVHNQTQEACRRRAGCHMQSNI
jgi:farnesyl diphosphate synthase